METAKVAITIFQGLLTPVVAGVAVYIAWQQWKTNKMKLKLDTYDRRQRVYQEVTKILGVVLRDAKVNTDELLRFRSAVVEADFLFDDDIPIYINQIYQHGLAFWRANTDYCDYTKTPPPGYDHARIVEQMDSELKWFTEQPSEAKRKFHKYLNVNPD
jgi:hypothetical protein